MGVPQQVVIVGGGIGGISTAAALRSGGFSGDITVVDDAQHPLDRPPLSKEYLAGTRGLTDIALEQPEWYEDHDVRLLTRTRVAALRPGEGVVETEDGRTLAAWRVVIATGGRAARPAIPGADSERVHVLRSVDDADRLRAAASPGARFLACSAHVPSGIVASIPSLPACIP